MLSIFGTLHLVKRCVPRRYSASRTYHWIGSEAVINYLNGLSGKQTLSPLTLYYDPSCACV